MLKNIKIIWNTVIVLGILYPAMAFIVTLLHGLNKGTMFTNPRFKDGVPLTFGILLEEFSNKRMGLSLISDQGNIALIHGEQDGTFLAGGRNVNKYDLPFMFEPGTYHLIACYNGMRDDIVSLNHKFIRDKKSATPWPIFILLYKEKMIVYSSKLVDYYLYLVSKLTFKIDLQK